MFANPNKPRVKEMMDYGLPKSVSQALYTHWGECSAGGIPCDMTKMAQLMKRALGEMDAADVTRVKQLQWHSRRIRAEKRSIVEEWTKGI